MLRKNALNLSVRSKGEEGPPTLLSDLNSQEDGAHLLLCRSSAWAGSTELSSHVYKYQEKPEHKGTSPALPRVSWIQSSPGTARTTAGRREASSEQRHSCAQPRTHQESCEASEVPTGQEKLWRELLMETHLQKGLRTTVY